ncbi:GDSL-type esterase/lipase family protein, partial [Hymenobacter setariae]|uniref:GDSL-type esterase/lipase family protein n=1 Tax=Hymenobacter setariae TaxID=2594794 RepID=UPI001F2666DE
MPLGNSITQGNTQHNSYRRALWFKLRNAGYNVDFVGSQHGNFGGAPPNPDFDMNSEGHWGWRADELLGSISSWATTYKPDIVLMHAGSNDMIQGQSVESTISEISQLIDRLRAANPNVKILLGQLIPTTLAANSNITALNNALPGLASQKSTAQSSIIIVNQNAGFNAATDTFDGVHPTDGGEEKMATKWYQALQPLLTATPPPAAIALRTPENPANTTAGLNYQYYEGTWLQLPDFNNLPVVKAGTTELPTLDMRNRDDDFAVRYTGFVDVPADGEYTFYTSSDDGSQLFIGSTLVVDNNGAHGLQERA